MTATSLDLSAIQTDATDYAEAFRTLVGVLSADETTALIDAIPEVDLSPYATVSYVDSGLSAKANENAVVKLTGTQTVAGSKTFTSPFEVVGTSKLGGIVSVNPYIQLHDNLGTFAGYIGNGSSLHTSVTNAGSDLAIRANGKFGISTNNGVTPSFSIDTAGASTFKGRNSSGGVLKITDDATYGIYTISAESGSAGTINFKASHGPFMFTTYGTVTPLFIDSNGITVPQNKAIILGDYSNSADLGGSVYLTWQGVQGVSPALQLGANDAASPKPQILQVQSVVAGTLNTAGVDFIVKGSAGTGTGAGGSIKFQVAPAGSSGSAKNTFADALVIDSTKSATFSGAVGIGTTPGIGDYDAKLHIQGNGSGTTGRTAFVVRNTNANSAAAFILMNNAGKSVTVQASGSSFIGGESAGVGTVGGLSLSFGTDGGATNTGTSPIIFSVGGWQSTQETMRIVPRGSAGSGRVLIGTTTDDGASRLQVAGAATFSGLLSCGVYTVATLPSPSANSGKEAQVTDSAVASSGNFGATVAGGGAHRVKVFSDGTNWIIN